MESDSVKLILKSILKLVECHSLEYQYPAVDLKKRTRILENEKENENANNKQPATSAAKICQLRLKQQAGKLKHTKKAKSKRAKKQLQQSGSKRPQIVAPTSPATRTFISHGLRSISPYQHSHLEPATLFPATGSYWLTASSLPIATYEGSLAQRYRLTGSTTGFTGSSGLTGVYPYSAESHMPSVYYERLFGYGGYTYPPLYHQPHYPM